METPEAVDERCEALVSLGSGVSASADDPVATLRAGLADASPRVRLTAARALGALLSRGVAPPALAAEVGCELADEAVSAPTLWGRQAAAAALAHAPVEALERLGEALERGDEEIRERAVRAAGYWGRGAGPGGGGGAGGASATGAEGAGGALAPEADGPARVAAAEAVLASALRDASPGVRAAAAQALGALPAAGPAVGALAACARGDADPAVRVAALGALGDAGVVDRDEAFAAAEAALADGVAEVVLAALDAAGLARRADRAARLLASLRPLARSRDQAVRVGALRVLASLGAEAAPAIDDVLAATTFRSWAVREQAVEAFAELAASGDSVARARLPALVASPSSGERYVGLRVAQRLGVVPAGLEAAVWATALDDRDARTRELASELAGQWFTPDGPLLERLAAALGARRPSARARAAVLGRALGPAASALVPALVRALPDPSRKVRRAAAEALGAVGGAAVPAIPPAVRRAYEGEETVRHAARGALKALAPELPPELRAHVAAVLGQRGLEEVLLGLIEGGLPERVTDELARVAVHRARWYASVAADPAAGPPVETPAGARGAVLAALEAAAAAAARRPRLNGGPGARQREVAWLLSFAMRTLLAPPP